MYTKITFNYYLKWKQIKNQNNLQIYIFLCLFIFIYQSYNQT